MFILCDEEQATLALCQNCIKPLQDLIETEGTSEDALELQGKLHDRYTKYLESHETALASVPEREDSLKGLSCIDIEKRHREASDLLQEYIDDGNKTERSMQVRELFTSKSLLTETRKNCNCFNKTKSSKRSSHSRISNSDRLSEARIQAELAKKSAEQQQLMQEAQKMKNCSRT